MFTGIITDIGTVESVTGKGEKTIALRTAFDTSKLAIGASIACDGACLTVVKKSKGRFVAVASAETLSCTTLGQWRAGTRVNLERALKMGDELGGHLVNGHVDGACIIEKIRQKQGSKEIWLAVPKALKKYIAPKGSVTLDGVSLTVNEAKGKHFSVNIIPHTLKTTTLGLKKAGDKLNLEIDLMARYAARLTLN
jgi:riboflavin synthase